MCILSAGENMNGIFENGREKECYRKARLKAEQVLERNGLSDSKTIEIVKLARAYGFVVATANLPTRIQGIIAYDESGEEKQFGTDYSKLIIVDKALTNEQKRFVTAHELGHYIIGDRLSASGRHVEARIDEHSQKEEIENEIDYFAACLLMPHKATKEIIDSGEFSGDKLIEKLSETFRVSSAVASRRIEEIRQLEKSNGSVGSSREK